MGKARWIVFDAETYRTRNPDAVAAVAREARERRPAQNTLKALKEQWDTPEGIAERIGEALAKTAVDPLRAEVLCICATTDTMAEPLPFDGMEQGRARALRQFAEWVGDMADRQTVFAGHNIGRFDLPLIQTEWQRHRIRPPENWPVYRRGLGPGRWFGRVFDTLQQVPSPAPFTSLDDACALYGLPCGGVEWLDEPMGGARVGAAFEAGEYDLIRRYCCQDVADEQALFLAMTYGASWGLWESDDPVAAQLGEIHESTLTAGQKWTAAMPILQSAGLLERV